VVVRASTPVLSPTGHLLFERDEAVWAIAFDPERAAASGQATQLLPPTTFASPLYGSLAYRLSSAGTLADLPRRFDDKRVLSIARDGGERALDLPPGPYGIPRISGDGRRLLLEGSRTLEALDFERGTRTRGAGGTFGTSFATWSSDSERIVYRPFTVPVWVATDGSGRGGAVPSASINDYAAGPGPDPDSILIVKIRPETAGDVFAYSLTGAFPPREPIATPAYEGGPELSPDRRWLVYQSNESGAPEIYVRRYPELDRAWQVSEGGGAQVRWSRDGREIYYRGGGEIMAASFDGSGAAPHLGRPTALFVDEFDFGPGITSPNYDVTPDGRFIFLRRTAFSGRTHVTLNWRPELRRLLAAGGAGQRARPRSDPASAPTRSPPSWARAGWVRSGERKTFV
jgi:serine/threonine-protein kinase